MVEYTLNLDLVFGSLADPTRRGILQQVSRRERPIKELSACYQMTFAGIAKHVHILEQAGLIHKRKEGREQIISANPKTIALSQKHLEKYQRLLNTRYDQLDTLLGN